MEKLQLKSLTQFVNESAESDNTEFTNEGRSIAVTYVVPPMFNKHKSIKNPMVALVDIKAKDVKDFINELTEEFGDKIAVDDETDEDSGVKITFNRDMQKDLRAFVNEAFGLVLEAITVSDFTNESFEDIIDLLVAIKKSKRATWKLWLNALNGFGLAKDQMVSFVNKCGYAQTHSANLVDKYLENDVEGLADAALVLECYDDTMVNESIDSDNAYSAIIEHFKQSSDSGKFVDNITDEAKSKVLELLATINSASGLNYVIVKKISSILGYSDSASDLAELLLPFVNESGSEFDATIDMFNFVYDMVDKTTQARISDIEEANDGDLSNMYNMLCSKLSKDDISKLNEYVKSNKSMLKYKPESFINESSEITSEAEFKEYAETVLKQAHGDDYDQSIADKTISDLTDKYKDDFGAMVGALTSGLGE